jgi:hypothetical protein
MKLTSRSVRGPLKRVARNAKSAKVELEREISAPRVARGKSRGAVNTPRSPNKRFLQWWSPERVSVTRQAAPVLIFIPRDREKASTSNISAKTTW